MSDKFYLLSFPEAVVVADPKIRFPLKAVAESLLKAAIELEFKSY